MRTRHLTQLLGVLALGLVTQACVVRETTPVNSGYGYGYGGGYASASVSVGQPSPYYVSSMPPEPLYEQMSVSPGYGHVWIDGYWHWNGYEWVWVGGRWEQQQSDSYVYVQPYYDYSGSSYVYTPGYWSTRDRAPRGWNIRDHRDGRPSTVVPPGGGVRPPPTGGGTRFPDRGDRGGYGGIRDPGPRNPGVTPPPGGGRPPEHGGFNGVRDPGPRNPPPV